MYLTREDIAAAVGKVELVQLSNDDGYGSVPDWESSTAPSPTPASWPTAI